MTEKKAKRGRPRLGPGPKGKRSPVLQLRVPRELMAKVKRRARLEKRPWPESVRERLGAPP